MALNSRHVTKMKWNICKLCGADLRVSGGESKRKHLKDKHGITLSSQHGGGSHSHYFTSEQYL